MDSGAAAARAASGCRSCRTSGRAGSFIPFPFLTRPLGRRYSALASPCASPSASRLIAATSRKNFLTGFAGAPAQRSPAGMSVITPAAAATWAPAPIVRCPGNARLPAERGEIADHARSRDAGLRHQHRMTADDDVVADLHQVVDLRPLADHGIAVRAAIDRHAGADLDIVLNDDAPDLGHFEMPPRPKGEPEAVLSDMRAGMNDHPVADQRRDDRGRGADRRHRDRCAPPDR